MPRPRAELHQRVSDKHHHLPHRIAVTAGLGVGRGSNVELLIEQVTGSHDYRSEGLSTVRYSVRSEEVRKVGSHAYTHLLLDF